MKEGWVTSTLEQICSKIGSGATPKGGQSAYKESGISLIRSLNVYDDGFRTGKLAFIDGDQADKLKNVEIEDGDILFNITGASVARCCVVPEAIIPARVNQHVSILRLLPDVMTSSFLHYLLTSKGSKDKLLGIGEQGSTRQAITKSQLQSFQISYPQNLTEQKQIVAILDKAFAAINQAKANIEKNIQNAKELFQSELNEIFSQKGEGWEEKTFQELSSRIGDGLHGTPKYDSSGEYFFINGNNLNDGVIEIKIDTKRVNEEEYNKHLRPLNSNTVLVSINGTLGKVAFYNNEPVILGKSACYINFDERVEKQYIKFLIQSPLFFKNMANESTGATIKNFSLKSMRNYKLPLPPKEEQLRIVKRLRSLDEEVKTLISKQIKKLANTEELKKSLLQKAFAGELTAVD